MTIILVYLIVSFLLDGLISTYLSINLINLSFLTTIYSVIALVISFNYFENYKKYLYIIIFLGTIFDIVYTNTFPLNIVIFLVIYFILNQLNYLIPNNILTINLKSLVSICIYHITTYIILVIIHYNSYPLSILGNILLRSIIMTIIYSSISYLIIKKIYWKKYNRKIK